MIREGKFIEDDFNLANRIYTRWYPAFSFELIIAEYDGYKPQNTFYKDLKEAFVAFVSSFYFIKLHKLNLSGSLFRDKNDTRYTGQGLELTNKIFSNYNESRLPTIFDDPDGEEILAIFLGLEYQSIDGEIYVNEQYHSLEFMIEYRNGKNQLVFYFEWGFGAEWFYNKYKVENRTIVRKAIIDFHESNQNYKELRMNHHLYLFDLELEAHTQKEVIVRRNM
jgi:hypothetical protein